MNVGDLCQHEVVSIPPSAGLTAAARVMRQEHVGYLVVVEPSEQKVERCVRA
jgi:predicted transcriptional regulator